MSKGLIYFCCACCILVLTIINLSIGPIISKKIGRDWGTLNCAENKDEYDEQKDNPLCDDDCLKYIYKWNVNECQRMRGMHDMEYTSFIFDITIGFVCGLLSLLHHFDLKKDFVSTTGLIGLGCGFVGFVLTFIYVIFNGLIYTTYDTEENKLDGDGAYAERVGNSADFKCLYYDEKNFHKVYATYSDFGKKQYNYDKDLYVSYITRASPFCFDESKISDCESQPTITLALPSQCQKVLAYPGTSISNKDTSDRFLTTLILSLIVCLANIGLALFGFLLFRTPGDF
jgi:hypothetical protein